MTKHTAKPAEASNGPGMVLDAGALRAIEHHHVELAVALLAAHRLNLAIRVPAAALAQVWRGGPRSAPLARLLRQPATVVAVDERAARAIGEFIARVRVPGDGKVDVVDAHVALVARATHSLVWTSDPKDMKRYGVPPEQIRKI